MSKVIVDEIQTDTTNGNVRVIPNGTGVLEVKGAGGDDAMLQLNCSAQSHGVKIKSPAHSAGQSYTMILPDNQIAADKYLKVKSITGSGATAVGQLEYADVAAGITSDSNKNTIGGTNAGGNLTNTAESNLILGYDAGTGAMSGDENVLLGFEAGKTLTSSYNVAIGGECLKSTANTGNVAIGRNCLELCTGGNNVAIGRQAAKNLTDADQHIAIGYKALFNLTSSATYTSNIAIGVEAGEGLTTGASRNVAIGYECMGGDPAGAAKFNTAMGYMALQNGGDEGENNTAIGYMCMRGSTSATQANYNAALGREALYSCKGDSNTAVGYQAGYDLSTGSNNLILGSGAGWSSSPSGQITTGSNNVVLGNNSISNLYCADTTISSSDSRDKTDITNFTIGLNWIEALRPVTYIWDRRTWYGTDDEPYGTPDGSKKRQRLHVGFLAQEALAVEQANGYGTNNNDSLAVHLNEDGMSYGIKYERLVPILVNAIKELSARVKTLEGG